MHPAAITGRRPDRQEFQETEFSDQLDNILGPLGVNFFHVFSYMHDVQDLNRTLKLSEVVSGGMTLFGYKAVDPKRSLLLLLLSLFYYLLLNRTYGLTKQSTKSSRMVPERPRNAALLVLLQLFSSR